MTGTKPLQVQIYPSVTPVDAYITKSVKIESGAKSALDPNSRRTIAPYVDGDLPTIDLTVPNVMIVDAERTFCDKAVILHGLRRWYDIRGQLRGNGQRISRHYYDLYHLLQSETGHTAIGNLALGLVPAYSSIALISTLGPPIHRPLRSARKAA